MSYKKITQYVLLSIPVYFVVILAYDAFAIGQEGTEASLSSFIITMAYKMPFAVFMTGLFNGILIGHLFWRMKGNNDTRAIKLDEKH